MAQAEVLTAARNLMERTDPATAGLWPRATALLARQALEATLDDLWRVRAAGMEQCSTRAQLLCLSYYLGDEVLAERVSYAWAGLSRACHQHPYELSPTSEELMGWLQTAEQLVGQVKAITEGQPAD
ncbi:MAG: hypothetical protein ABI665_27205 [Vicinamibacterales bacterium]